MQVFNCEACGHLIYFESLQCVHCGAAQAFLPDQLRVGILPSAQPSEAGGMPRYRACAHRHDISLCNFAIEASDPHTLCVSCRQTEWLPDAGNPANQLRWAKIEVAKRRLYYTLAKLGLEGPNASTPTHLRFSLLADIPGAAPIMTGHASGMITLNVVEADDDERAKRRLALHEPYRTLIGHLRHESGHFYWDQLIAHSAWLEPFRALFGYEGHDYSQALKQHYDKNPFDTQWRENFISAYATSHAWEDWAETWAHYLHMVDLMETAASYHTCITVPDIPNRGPQSICNPLGTEPVDFELMQSQWVPLTLLHNSLNRSLGHEDAYPFAISAAAWNKLRFVHDLIQANRQRSAAAPTNR
ncbi:putative zinc-binding metallopeptidase [Comamonas resistens]|uniref:Zinc-binding metallopeptidase n=1 Tax=Comamonas resistens TaxID=3046670 RepID=A0ABY8SNX5_9BURK|nr:putative zinc-binding metallopeptidase [Comamonas resistens]MDL5038487.1 putative zinc-binding metallopeptidase [Comamonas resistens]WHS64638.1 putative zinc-binding metallopeptidase [Comamonas resistens]